MQYKISGTVMQTVELDLPPGHMPGTGGGGDSGGGKIAAGVVGGLLGPLGGSAVANE